jgi:hypothetical protein
MSQSLKLKRRPPFPFYRFWSIFLMRLKRCLIEQSPEYVLCCSCC